MEYDPSRRVETVDSDPMVLMDGTCWDDGCCCCGRHDAHNPDSAIFGGDTRTTCLSYLGLVPSSLVWPRTFTLDIIQWSLTECPMIDPVRCEANTTQHAHRHGQQDGTAPTVPSPKTDAAPARRNGRLASSDSGGCCRSSRAGGHFMQQGRSSSSTSTQRDDSDSLVSRHVNKES